MSAPTPAQPTDPNGVLTYDYGEDLPEGYEWVAGCRIVREARPIPEPTIDVRLRVKTARILRILDNGTPADAWDEALNEVGDACAEALSREGLT